MPSHTLTHPHTPSHTHTPPHSPYTPRTPLQAHKAEETARAAVTALEALKGELEASKQQVTRPARAPAPAPALEARALPQQLAQRRLARPHA